MERNYYILYFRTRLFNDAKTNSEEEKRLAGVSSIDNLKLITSALKPEGQTYLKPQDGFTIGEFEVEISVTSDEGRYSEERFRIHVESDFQRLSMKKIHPWRKLKIV